MDIHWLPSRFVLAGKQDGGSILSPRLQLYGVKRFDDFRVTLQLTKWNVLHGTITYAYMQQIKHKRYLAELALMSKLAGMFQARVYLEIVWSLRKYGYLCIYIISVYCIDLIVPILYRYYIIISHLLRIFFWQQLFF